MTAINGQISLAAEKDVKELEVKIQAFLNGEMPEDKFKSFRLTRGVYGQRQLGVQMYRIKLPAGRISPAGLVRIADLSEQYASGNLHLTTRQDIQLHYVKVTDTPAIYEGLESAGITSREACGNTVRNITASSEAGIDPEEPFDVTPHAYAAFEYLLRNPICQDMGRKIKIGYSSSEKDSAFAYIHDFGFLPRIVDGKKGYRVLVGGGLGAQAFLAQEAYDFLPDDQVIPFLVAGLRVFDRYGERTRRNKARLKYLIKEIGLPEYMRLVAEEWRGIPVKTYPIDPHSLPEEVPAPARAMPVVQIADQQRYQDWLKTNTFRQKQDGYFAVYLKVTNGDIKPVPARTIAELAENYASQVMRVTMNQGMMLRFVREEALPYVYSVLDSLGFAKPGFGTIADVTTCPGTDTCNLGVTDSMLLAKILEEVIEKEYYPLIFDHAISIKMSGCMNSCGQHMSANIGLHGSSIRVGDKVAPAMQVVLGGGVDHNGTGTVGDKIVKLPTKKMPDALRTLLNDYEEKAVDGEYFNDYYRRMGKNYFYTMLKPFADHSKFVDDDYFDFGSEAYFTPEIGVGECAGVMYDMVGAILKEAELKLNDAREALSKGDFAEAIYYAYTGFVTGAKAVLLTRDVECNTQIKILQDFDRVFVATNEIAWEGTFEDTVLSLKSHEPDEAFAKAYVEAFEHFLGKIAGIRSKATDEQLVIESHYKA
jgi:sulfite reductase (ferredoxin)